VSQRVVAHVHTQQRAVHLNHARRHLVPLHLVRQVLAHQALVQQVLVQLALVRLRAQRHRVKQALVHRHDPVLKRVR